MKEPSASWRKVPTTAEAILPLTSWPRRNRKGPFLRVSARRWRSGAPPIGRAPVCPTSSIAYSENLDRPSTDRSDGGTSLEEGK